MTSLPNTGFLREKQIIGDSTAVPPVDPIIPISRSAWWAGVKDGRYPKPVKLSKNTTVWRISDIRKLIESI